MHPAAAHIVGGCYRRSPQTVESKHDVIAQLDAVNARRKRKENTNEMQITR